MAIGRTEDRDTPGNPTVLRHREYVRDPVCAIHLGQRSIRPRTQAGHMTAIDQTRRSCQTLQTGARPHMDSGLCPSGSPEMTIEGEEARMRFGVFGHLDDSDRLTHPAG
jgi:hypothetical protein